MYLLCLSLNKKSLNSFTACFKLSCDMLVHSIEETEVETEEVILLLFSLLISVGTPSILWVSQKHLTLKNYYLAC